MKQSVAILNFGTSKITVVIGSRGINESINIEGIGGHAYDGYSRGMWLCNDSLSAAIGAAIARAEQHAQIKISKLYIGVPNEFSECHLCDVSISLNKKRKITEQDISTLRDSGNCFKTDQTRTVINIQPVYYTLDNERKLLDPIGMTSTRIGGVMSYTLARNDFISTIDGIVSAYSYETEYVSASLAEMMLLFDERRRDKTVMYANVGALGTAFAMGRGDAICVQNYFAWGGARITAALMDKFGIAFEQAEQLKHKVILSLEPDYVPPPDEPCPIVMQTEYEIEVDSEKKTFDVSDTNLAVRLEIERFARYIEKALKTCKYTYPENTVLSITGGGLGTIRGAAEYLAECLNREVETVKPSQPLLDGMHMSAALGLLNFVLMSEQVGAKTAGILQRLFSGRNDKGVR